MNENQTRDLEFHQNLGKLFYAVAFTDKNMVKDEFSSLITCFDDLSFHHVFPKTDFKFQVISTFNALYPEHVDAKNCFNEFIDYVRRMASSFQSL